MSVSHAHANKCEPLFRKPLFFNVCKTKRADWRCASKYLLGALFQTFKKKVSDRNSFQGFFMLTPDCNFSFSFKNLTICSIHIFTDSNQRDYNVQILLYLQMKNVCFWSTVVLVAVVLCFESVKGNKITNQETKIVKKSWIPRKQRPRERRQFASYLIIHALERRANFPAQNYANLI